MSAAASGNRVEAPYLLADMAEDALAVFEALGVGAAHLVGASMGGMIAQALAIRHPDRVRSLTAIMSTTGDPAVGYPHAEALPALLQPAPADREGYAEHHVLTFTTIGSPGYPPDVEQLRARGRTAYDRCFHPVGTARQLLAIAASPDRTPALRTLTVPTLVIHGEADLLIDVSGGRAIAAAVPGARLVTIPGMGHDLPPDLWPAIVDEIAMHAKAADNS
jgi:pimeloyl-ACP methyl ester carboxylesterase